MSGRKLLLDSNILIYLAQKKLMPSAFIRPDDLLYISDITYMETMGFNFPDNDEKVETEALIGIMHRLPIDELAVQEVIKIRQTKKVKLPDAIIAATAMTSGCCLVTRNVSDFNGLNGLELLDPFTE